MKLRIFLFAVLMLLAEAQKAQWELDPVLGEDLQELARRVVEQPPAVIEQIKRILRSN